MSKRFIISMDIRCELSEEEIWPDGDAPENPTCENVDKLIEKCHGPAAIISDWNLQEDLDCFVTEVF